MPKNRSNWTDRKYKLALEVGTTLILPKGTEELVRSNFKDPREAESVMRHYHGLLDYCKDGVKTEVPTSWLNLATDSRTQKRHREWLAEQGLIELDKSTWYVANPAEVARGERSHSYSYTINRPTTEIEYVATGKRLVSSPKRQPYLKQQQLVETRNFLKALSVDCEAVEAFLADESQEARERLQRPLLALEKANYGISRDDSVNRLHSVLTQTDKRFRKFLKHESGETLVAWDLSASHPTLIGHLSGCEDIVNDALAGTFYEKMMAEFGIAERAEAKTTFFGWLYSINSETKLTQYMRTHYPKATDYAREAKLEDTHNAWANPHYKNRKRKDGTTYRALDMGAPTLATKMMRLEAELFIDTAYAQCIEAGIPSATIHDSIVTIEERADEVFQILTDTFSERGITHRFVREFWSKTDDK